MGAVLALALAVLAAPGSAPAQEPPLSDLVQAEMAVAQDLFTRATTEFEGPQQSRSIVLLDDVIAKLEDLRKRSVMPARARDMLVHAYEMRARAYINIGLQEKAAESFRLLLQVQPGFVLTKDKVSPKIVDYFNVIKKSMVGFLAVASHPAGAKVSLNGEFLALTDFFPMEVLAGDYTVEIARDGYLTESRTVSIAPRATETLQVDLARTAASSFFVTDPSGVEIWVDGAQRTRTEGNLSPDLYDAAREKGLDPARASARVEVANLTLGSHVIEFRKPCFETVRRTIDVPEARDYEADPVRLADSQASLRLESDPPGAQIFLDGENKGLTPKDLDGVCSGRHRVEVKHAAGKFIQEIVLAKGDALSLDCPIRPSLAFLGVVSEAPAGERRAQELEATLRDEIGKVHSLNVLSAPRDIPERFTLAEKVTPLAVLTGTAEPDVIRRVTEKVAEALEVQGFLLAVLPDEKLQRTMVLYLLAAGNTVADRAEVGLADPAGLQKLLERIDQRATMYRPWAGVVSVDSSQIEGAAVLRVAPVSPAATAGIKPGEVVVAADGKPVKATADVLATLAGKKEKEKLALHLSGPAGSRAVELVLGRTPQEIPLNDPALIYNKVMMDLRQQVQGYPGTEAAAYARLNLAICALHFGDFAAAHDHLLKARTELPARPGVSQGTALYYLGVALERLGYAKDAQDAWRSAAQSKDATLFNNDGPSVAAVVATRSAVP